MAKKMIIANWKMNPWSLKEAKEIFGGIKKTAVKLKKTETVVCPPFIYLNELKTKNKGIKTGAQDIFWDDRKTSYTGEISAGMLKDAGVEYVIIGHSERREYLKETNETVNKKIKTALKNGFQVIFCIGERSRSDGEDYLTFVREEIEEGLKGAPRKLLKNLIVAYEPIWAIGKKASEADTPEDVLQMVIYIRRIILPFSGKDLARQFPVLYGGSVNPENAESFLSGAGVQGLLIGHESLISDHFGKILKIAEKIK